MIAARLAFRQAGAGWALTLLIGFAAASRSTPPPIGPSGLVCFGAALLMVDAPAARDATALASAPVSAAT